MITTKVKWKAIFVSLFFLCLYLFLLYIVIFIAVYITYTYTTDEDDTDSRQELAEKGYTLPEYAFVVECAGVTSGESGVLEVRGWIHQKVKYYKSGSEVKNMKYHLEFSDTYGIEGRIAGGLIKEEKLPLGNIVLRISLK